MVEQEIDRRRTSPEKYHRRDLLSQVLEDMDEEKFLNEDMTIHLVLSVLIVKGESISTSLTLVFRAPCRQSISASRKWKNPSSNGVLPPGSMGLPLIGETLHLIIPSYSLDLHPFIKKRIQRFGPIFRTNILGRPVVTHFPSFSIKRVKLGQVRLESFISISLTHFGVETLKEGLLPEIEDMIKKTLQRWSTQESIEVKYGYSVMVFNYIAKHMFGYDDSENTSEDKISEKFTIVSELILMSIPLNIPGTTYHKCLKDREKATKFLKDKLEERRNSPDMYRGDLLGQVNADLNKEDKEKFLSDDFIITVIFGLLFAGFESVSKILTLTLKLLADHPSVLQELIAEHEGILKNRRDSDPVLTWYEYKSMTFTLQVGIDPVNIASQLSTRLTCQNLTRPRLTRVDHPTHDPALGWAWFYTMSVTPNECFSGFTIPAGWIIMAVTSASHLNPAVYKDPLAFNPARWNGGTRQSAGAEFSKLLMATFLHVLLAKYERVPVSLCNILVGKYNKALGGLKSKYK
ncbi:hypothetical protein NC651_011726 [Populus alba x Populus x berolinensis]|nr:hypothetical protein NC651_011726 [Populus alba x Populus x berolinensis]